MKMKLVRSEQGFSLVELMVVVAIIGILATIGIPQYQKFMSKARQAEAKTHLNAIFQGESSFFTEYNQYTTNMQAIGAGAVGTQLRYNAGFDITACTDYVVGPAPALGAAGTNDIKSLGTAANWYWNAAGVADPGTAITACVSTAGAQTYTAGAWGNPTNIQSGANNNADQFTINQNRVLSQIAVGI